MSSAIELKNSIITIDLNKFKGQTVQEVERQFKVLMTSIKLRYEVPNHKNPEIKRYQNEMLEDKFELKLRNASSFMIDEVLLDNDLFNVDV